MDTEVFTDLLTQNSRTLLLLYATGWMAHNSGRSCRCLFCVLVWSIVLYFIEIASLNMSQHERESI